MGFLRLLSIFNRSPVNEDTNGSPRLIEQYPTDCIESKSNREYLEDFFDVKNVTGEQELKIIPNCPSCTHQFRCVTGVHVLHHYKLGGNRRKVTTPSASETEPQEKQQEPESGESKTRFTDIIE
jgi:hypothetical protein